MASVQRVLTPHANSYKRPSLAPHVTQRLLRNTSGTSTVQSTLDGRLQELTADALRGHLLAMQTQHVYDRAVLVVENASGEVLAYNGGSAKLSSARHVDGVQGRRQTGCILKLVLYGLALERKILTPASLLEDEPLAVPVLGGVHRPRSYDERFRRLVTQRTALAASLNILALRNVGRIVFAGDNTSAGQHWLLNGQEVGPATGLLRWEPVPGQYTLSVVDHQGRGLDTVSFEVRPGLTTVDSPPSQ